MSLANPSQYSTLAVAAQPRVSAKSIRPKTLAAGSGTLAILNPLVRTASTGFYKAWAPPVSQVNTITKAGTVSGGTYTVSIDGAVSSAIAYNAANATILAALLALPNVRAGDVTLTGGGAAGVNTGALTLTFGGAFTGRAFTLATDSTSLTGGGTFDAAVGTAGVDSPDDELDIAGFVWPEAVTLDSDEEVITTVLLEGVVHVDDIALNSQTLANLKIALKRPNVRRNGLIIDGLAGQ